MAMGDDMMRSPGEPRLSKIPCTRLVRALASVASLVAAGCSGGNPYDMVAVSGTVKYEDGSLIPAETIILKFEPQAQSLDAKTHPRKAFGRVDVATGAFDTITTHKYGDGIVAGKHKVLIMSSTKEGKITKLVPNEYMSSADTPIEVDTADQPFEIRVKKPSGSS
jgi:hypothetical protein